MAKGRRLKEVMMKFEEKIITNSILIKKTKISGIIKFKLFPTIL